MLPCCPGTLFEEVLPCPAVAVRKERKRSAAYRRKVGGGIGRPTKMGLSLETAEKKVIYSSLCFSFSYSPYGWHSRSHSVGAEHRRNRPVVSLSWEKRTEADTSFSVVLHLCWEPLLRSDLYETGNVLGR